MEKNEFYYNSRIQEGKIEIIKKDKIILNLRFEIGKINVNH